MRLTPIAASDAVVSATPGTPATTSRYDAAAPPVRTRAADGATRTAAPPAMRGEAKKNGLAMPPP